MTRADLLMAIVFIILSAAVLYGSWTMDRLEVRRIHPMTVPGLVPGMLGAALLVCGIVLAIRSLRLPAPNGWADLAAAITSGAAGRAAAVLALALVYTLVLVGRVPFWLATGLFVFAFILLFEVWLATPRRALRQSLPWAIGLAIATAGIVTFVFERAFLVRLP
ncbi:hypothetical protein VW29_20310 [Devosia limi DSM 17137]|nr:hypothetical protein VW29_20310 [Devosia limi DSM 17137]